jgi:hypothetical protein
MATFRSTAFTTTMRHSLAGAYQNTFGSRNSPDSMSRTGFPAYLVKVFPPSVL